MALDSNKKIELEGQIVDENGNVLSNLSKDDVQIEIEQKNDNIFDTSMEEIIDDDLKAIEQDALSSIPQEDVESNSMYIENPNIFNNNDTNQVNRDFSNDYSPRISNIPSPSTRPNTYNRNDSSLPKNNNLDKKEEDSPLKNNNGYNPNESAPDIGKDYGSSEPQNSNNIVNPNNSNDSNTTNLPNIPNQDFSQNTDNNMPVLDSLPKKDGLDKNNNLDKKEENDNKNSSSNNKTSDEEQIPQQNQQNIGNGYGALNGRNNHDGTDLARRNLEHSRRMQEGQNNENGVQNPNQNRIDSDVSTQGNISFMSSLGAGLKGLLGGKSQNDISNNNDKKEDEKSKNPFSGIFGKSDNKIINYLKRNPHIVIILGVVLLFFLIILTTLDYEGGGNGNKCIYELNGVLKSGPVKLEGVQVELVNCDASASNYTVLETIDFEKYVIGVAYAEVSFSRSEEYFKTQIIAARSFALTRNRAMCPSRQDNCFYGYNPNTGKIRLRACANDQVYCDYEKDCYRLRREGNGALVSPEVNASTPGAYLWKPKASETLLKNILAAAEEVKGKVAVDLNGNAYYTNFIDANQNAWFKLAEQGYNAEQIITMHYKDSVVKTFSCSSSNSNSTKGIDYGNYVLSSEGTTILRERLSTFLPKQGTSLEEYNQQIEANVNKAGYGTSEGVVAAAVTLIGELGNKYNVRIPYYWGGGHRDGILLGAGDYWGKPGSCPKFSPGGGPCGLDCSGFVMWAIYNGGFNIRHTYAHQFQYLPGAQRVKLANSAILEPGDLLESDTHVILVIGVEESTGKYICAEASGSNSGVIFSKHSFKKSGYWGVKMGNYYKQNRR